MKNDIDLPQGILASDLKYPKWDAPASKKYAAEFDLWFTERFGWCIPTLFISKARRGSGVNDRTYGISMDGTVVTMGKGPHILKTVKVYVKKNRLAALQTFLDLKTKGESNAGQIRDRISTRRAQTALFRATYGHY